jgi:membrane protein
MRVREQLNEDNASLLAAGVGLFALLAAFPALAALVSFYAIFPTPGQISDHLEPLSGLLPGAALGVLREQLTSVASTQSTTLGVGAVIGFVLALWGARKGMAALMQACNVAYDETRRRGVIGQIIVSLGFTFGAMVYFVLTSAVAVGLPFVLESWLGDRWLMQVLTALRWVLLWIFVVFALAVIYRYAPVRRRARWRWVTWGSVAAATLWVVASIAFEVYVRTFGSFAETYGAIGGVVVLLLWLYLSGSGGGALSRSRTRSRHKGVRRVRARRRSPRRP